MRSKWTLLAFLCATFALYTLDRALLGSLAIPIQRDTGISDVQFGLLNAAVFWTYSVLVPFAGYAGDRFSRAKMIGFASVLWSAMTLLSGFANGFWTLFLLVSFAVTAPQTLYTPSAVSLIAERHRETRTIAMSCHQAAFYTGWLASGAFVAAVLSLFGSWRIAYFVLGALGLVLGLVFLLVFRGESGGTRTAAEIRRESPTFLEALRTFFGCPSAVLAAVGHVAVTFVAFGYSAWGPKFVAQKFSISPGAAAAGVMFWHFAAAFAAIVAAGWVTDRLVHRWPRFRLVFQMVSLLLAAPMLCVFGCAPSLMAVWAGAALFGLFRGSFEANSINSVFDVVPSRTRASAMGFLNVLAGVLGSFAPLLMGGLSQREGVRGLEMGFMSLGAVLAFACLALFLSFAFTFRRDCVKEDLK